MHIRNVRPRTSSISARPTESGVQALEAPAPRWNSYLQEGATWALEDDNYIHVLARGPGLHGYDALHYLGSVELHPTEPDHVPSMLGSANCAETDASSSGGAPSSIPGGSDTLCMGVPHSEQTCFPAVPEGELPGVPESGCSGSAMFWGQSHGASHNTDVAEDSGMGGHELRQENEAAGTSSAMLLLSSASSTPIFHPGSPIQDHHTTAAVLNSGQCIAALGQALGLSFGVAVPDRGAIDLEEDRWTNLIEDELNAELHPRRPCHVCRQRPSNTLITSCMHCVLCVECAVSQANLDRPMPDILPCHLYDGGGRVWIACPSCQEPGVAQSLWPVRDWACPSHNGLCCVCKEHEADVMLTCCMRVAYCTSCAQRLSSTPCEPSDFGSEDTAPIIWCPGCTLFPWFVIRAHARQVRWE
ncbi:unnamed protein product [Ostreobium quekettii]|uniref:RING-type domain-containing protein n=1 Tax=Ostreobium quekettii TaxID=121088 RepID=A0A8S1J2H8_9CHLO|nr:unnamed protein product [Ostreobium quekettii]|eukprot:evm.model.scf_917.2 EVM.evm.TU.scf_917.2   scf_917:14403-16182(+)